MEVENTSVAAPDTTTSAPVTEAPAPSSTPSADVGASVQPEQMQAAPNTQPATLTNYQPNFKFKVMNREHEIPEQFRSVIKDADSEKMAREIFEKAYGLDHVKSERARLQDEYKSYKGQTEPIMKVAQQLEYFRQKGDLNSYFKTLGLDKQQIWSWAVQQAQIEELPDHQRRVYDEHQEAQARAYALEQQLQEQQAMLQQVQVQQRQAELYTSLSKPDVSNFVSLFDQRNGEGAFRDEVIARGQWYWHSQGADVPPERLVSEIMQKYGAFSAPSAQPQAQAPMQSQPQAPKAPSQVPVIPNTGSGTASPAQRSIKSLDDIKKVYQEKFGS